MVVHEVVYSDNPLLPIKIWNQQLSGPELTSPIHWHRSLEILFVASGRVRLEIEGQTLELNKEELVVINSGDLHQISAVEPNDAMEGITILIPNEFLQLWFPEADKGRFDPRLVQENKELLKEQVKMIGSLYEKKGLYHEVEITSQLLLLLSQLYKKTRVPVMEEDRMLEIKERLSTVLDLIEKSYQSPLTLEEAAATAGYSVSYFSKIFTATMKRSFYQYLINFRLAKSLKELQLTEKTVTDIAENNGFSSLHSYIQSFKRNYGMTPKDYQMRIRNRHKKEKI